MTQLTYGNTSALGFEGDLDNTGVREVLTKQAAYDIEFGRFLSYADANKATVDTIGTNKVTLALSGALVTSNVFAFTLKITNLSTGAETVNSMTETYASSSDATIDALVVEIEALTGIAASGTSRSGNGIIIGASSGYIIEVSDEEVTLGSSQATVTKTNDDTRVRAGFALRENKEPFLESGSYVSRYQDNEPVSVIKKGNMVAYSSTGFNGTDTLYVVGYGTNRGRIANAAGDNGIAIGSYVSHYATAAASGKGAVSINLP
jgi:hypothetical protein